VKVLLIEDQAEKIDCIKRCIEEEIGSSQVSIISAKYLNDARRNIIAESFDLIVFDIYLPISCHEEGNDIDVSVEIIQEFTKSKNYRTEAIAITKYDVSDIENISDFNDAGVTVVQYEEGKSAWRESLKVKLKKVAGKVKYDFLIFCALNKERAAYSETDSTIGGYKQLHGLNCQDMQIGGFKGLCITPSKMGLVNMAIAASKAIENFQPKIVSMSGICAGVQGESNFLDIIIGDMCWEYQTGKYKDKQFKQEPYQCPLDNQIKIELEQFVERKGEITKLKEGLFDTELKSLEVIVGPISSGSAVIASEAKMKEIGMQHRKMAGLEMEMYALYEAASQSLSKPLFFGAKSVVDLGDSSKGDTFHDSACIVSARLIVNFLTFKLPNL